MDATAYERARVASGLRSALAEAGLTQEAFARLLGTSRPRLSAYLNGRTIPSAALYLRALRTAALDERIKVTVDLNCLTDYQTILEEKGLERHGIYYYVPDLLTHFTTSDINALIAPRPHFGLAGSQDPLTPMKGLEIIDANLKKAYATKGAPEAWQLKIYNVGHLETAEMRQDIMAFLKKWL